MISKFQVVENGDLFAGSHDILVCPVNLVPGVMGKGLAKAFVERFPDLKQDHYYVCKTFGIGIGSPCMRCLYTPKVILFPTKVRWQDPSRPEWIFVGLANLYAICRNHDPDAPVTSIGMPALGCGLGGLPFGLICPMIKCWAAGLPSRYIVTLYAPRKDQP